MEEHCVGFPFFYSVRLHVDTIFALICLTLSELYLMNLSLGIQIHEFGIYARDTIQMKQDNGKKNHFIPLKFGELNHLKVETNNCIN